MLTVHTAPTIERNEGGWEITLWLGQDFDWSTPFRASLAEIAGALGCEATALELPPYVPDEDFVDGTLSVQGSLVRVYFEYSLGYLSLISDDRDVLERVAARIFPLVQVQ
jgi:hypothetical protein